MGQRAGIYGTCCAIAALAMWGASERMARAASETEWRNAVVEMSDGRSLTGRFSITANQFHIQNEAEKTRFTIRIGDIRRIENLVEKESLERKWIFKEDGRDEKVYTGETYPVRYFLTRVTFGDGKTMEGHVISQPCAIEVGEERERIFLTRKMEGKVGEKLEDLPYAKVINFKDGGGTVLGNISGTVKLPQGEKPLRVAAIHRQKDFSIDEDISKDGAFHIDKCPGGAYDVVVVSDRAVYVGFSREKEEGCRRFDAAALKGVSDWAAKVRDFFQTHDALYAAGNDERAYVLVRMERRGGTSMEGAELVRRYEVWLMSKANGEWSIEKRFYVSRTNSGNKNLPREDVVICPKLGGSVLDAQHPDFTLTFDRSPAVEIGAR